MTQVRTYRRITRSDIPDAPDWADIIFDNVTNQLADLTDVVNGQLDPFTNSFSRFVEFETTDNEITDVFVQTILNRNTVFVQTIGTNNENIIMAAQVVGFSDTGLRIKVKLEQDIPTVVRLLIVGAN